MELSTYSIDSSWLFGLSENKKYRDQVCWYRSNAVDVIQGVLSLDLDQNTDYLDWGF